MPLGTWMLELPEVKEIKQECFGSDVQLTDFCEFGLKDSQNKLPHKRSTTLLATFQLRRLTRLCNGHGRKDDYLNYMAMCLDWDTVNAGPQCSAGMLLKIG